jgi:hypothetical protein
MYVKTDLSKVSFSPTKTILELILIYLNSANLADKSFVSKQKSMSIF